MSDKPNTEGIKSDAGATQRRRGVVMSYAYTISQIVVNLLYVPILLSGIGASEYGLYQLIGSIMAYVAIMNTTFASGTTRFYCDALVKGDVAKMENVLATCRTIYRVTSIAACVVAVVLIPAITVIYRNVLTPFQLIESSVMLVVMIGNLIITMNNTVNVAAITAHERFVFLKTVQLATVIVQPLLIIVVIQFAPYALSIVGVQFAMGATCAIIQRYYARRILAVKVILHEKDKVLLKELLAYSGAIVLVIIADQVFWKTNQLIIGYYYGTVEVAVYAIAAQVYMSYYPLGTAISSVFMPKLTELRHRQDYQQAISSLFSRVGRASFFVLYLVLSGFAILGFEFIGLWAGPDYSDAYYIALLIMVPFTIDLVQNLGLTIMQVENKYMFRGKMFITIAAINIVLVLIVAPIYGSIGAALCTGVISFIGNGIIMNAYYHVKLGLDIKLFWRNIGSILLILLPFSLVVYGLNAYCLNPATNWGFFAVKLIVYSALYACMAYVAANQSERSFIKKILNKLIIKKAN